MVVSCRILFAFTYSCQRLCLLVMTKLYELLAEQLHQAVNLLLRSLKVFDTESVDGDNIDTEIHA